MNLFMTVTLQCDDGEMVGQVQVPFDKEIPVVLTWGCRVFRIYEELTYREVASYDIPIEGVK